MLCKECGKVRGRERRCVGRSGGSEEKCGGRCEYM